MRTSMSWQRQFSCNKADDDGVHFIELCLQGGDWDPNSMRNLLGTPMGTALHPQLSGSANALTGLPGAPLARNPSDAGSELNLSLHNLRSKSPWEGGHGTQASLLAHPQDDSP